MIHLIIVFSHHKHSLFTHDIYSRVYTCIYTYYPSIKKKVSQWIGVNKARRQALPRDKKKLNEFSRFSGYASAQTIILEVKVAFLILSTMEAFSATMGSILSSYPLSVSLRGWLTLNMDKVWGGPNTEISQRAVNAICRWKAEKR